MDRPLRSPSGGIQVLTTERGLPTALKLHQRELTKSPQDLAREVLALCQLSAARAQVARRRDLAARGFPSNVVNALPLATEGDLVAAERAVRGDEDPDELPDSWMKSV